MEVESRIVGGNPELPKLDPILVRFETMEIAVSDLIRRAVEEHIWTLLSTRRMQAEEARRVLERHYLTESEVASQAQQGAVRMPGRGMHKPTNVDVEDAVQQALRAFEAGAYLVLVDGRQVHSLAERVTIGQASRAQFLRLVPLVGG